MSMKSDVNAVGFGFYAVNENNPEIYEKILTSDYSNVMFVYGRPEDMIRQIKRIKEHGKTCWLGVFDYVYQVGKERTILKPDYKENLTEMVNALEKAGVYDVVRGIYFDEPLLCRISKEDLRTATGFYRSLNTGKGVLVCFSVTPICPEIWRPDYPVDELDERTCEFLTDVAFDFYDDYEENKHWYSKLVERLDEITKNLDVRYWYVPNTMSYKGKSDENESITQTNALCRFLQHSKKPGGMMCYSYYTFPPEVENLGNINLDILFDKNNPDRWERLEKRLMEIGRNIVSGNLDAIG